jgi:hypothetical protein
MIICDKHPSFLVHKKLWLSSFHLSVLTNALNLCGQMSIKRIAVSSRKYELNVIDSII